MGLGTCKNWEDFQARREKAAACAELVNLLQQFAWIYPDEADLIGDVDDDEEVTEDN